MMLFARIRNRSYAIAVASIIIMIVLPNLLAPAWISILIYTLLYVYLCIAWNISVMPGLFSLMQSVFFGCGAYVAAFLWMKWNYTPWLGMLAGSIAAVLLALVIGWLCFRLYFPTLAFGIFTLAVSYIALFIVDSVSVIREGLAVRYVGTNVLHFQFQNKLVFYYILLAMVIGIIILSKHIINSKMGIYFYAIHGNERVAAAGGVNVMLYKIIAFAISGGLTALAGTFWTQYSHFIAADAVGPHMTIIVILLTVIGGSGTLWGPVIGAAFLVPIGEALRIYFSTLPGLHFIMYGVIVVVILLSLREGVVPWLQGHYRRSGREGKEGRS